MVIKRRKSAILRADKFAAAFTLVELMVVILIVAILAAVALPVMRNRVDAAKWSEGKAIMGSIATSIRAWCAEKDLRYSGTLPTTLAELGFAVVDCTGTYFVDNDFEFVITDVGPPPQFTVTCTAGKGGRTNAPTNPPSYTLTGEADGTMTWSE